MFRFGGEFECVCHWRHYIHLVKCKELLLNSNGKWSHRFRLYGSQYGDWPLTHWGRVTHICVGKLAIIGSDNGLSPGRRQAIIWTNAWIIVNCTLRNKRPWNFNRNWNIFNQEKAFENVVWKMSAILSRAQCVHCHSMNKLFMVRWLLTRSNTSIVIFSIGLLNATKTYIHISFAYCYFDDMQLKVSF